MGTVLYEGIALYEFVATQPSQLSLRPRLKVRVTHDDNSGWCYGQSEDGGAGYFPKSYVQKPPPPPSAPPPPSSAPAESPGPSPVVQYAQPSFDEVVGPPSEPPPPEAIREAAINSALSKRSPKHEWSDDSDSDQDDASHSTHSPDKRLSVAAARSVENSPEFADHACTSVGARRDSDASPRADAELPMPSEPIQRTSTELRQGGYRAQQSHAMYSQKPTLKITLESPEEVKKTFKHFIVFAVKSEISEAGSSDTRIAMVRRKYSDFEYIEEHLKYNVKKSCRGVVVPPLPSDKDLGGFSRNEIWHRQRALELFLRRIARNPFLANMSGFMQFLTDAELKCKKPNSVQLSPAVDNLISQVNRDSALECFGMLAPTIERNKKYIDKLEQVFAAMRTTMKAMVEAEKEQARALVQMEARLKVASFYVCSAVGQLEKTATEAMVPRLQKTLQGAAQATTNSMLGARALTIDKLKGHIAYICSLRDAMAAHDSLKKATEAKKASATDKDAYEQWGRVILSELDRFHMETFVDLQQMWFQYSQNRSALTNEVAVVWKGMMDACAANVIALPDVMESMEDVDSKSIFDLADLKPKKDRSQRGVPKEVMKRGAADDSD